MSAQTPDHFAINSRHRSRLRPDNRPLSDLLSRSVPIQKRLQAAIDSLPQLAGEMYCNAKLNARGLLGKHSASPMVFVRDAVVAALCGRSTKVKQLAESIFDLQLTVLFSELTKFLDDNELASLFVDAALYQATGSVAASPTDEQVWNAGTQRVRGIHKFWRAGELMPGIRDIDSAAWVFGKEYSAIVCGNPKDIARIAAVAPISLQLRVEAKRLIRFVLYGEIPTEAAMSDLHATVQRLFKDFYLACGATHPPNAEGCKDEIGSGDH